MKTRLYAAPAVKGLITHDGEVKQIILSFIHRIRSSNTARLRPIALLLGPGGFHKRNFYDSVCTKYLISLKPCPSLAYVCTNVALNPNHFIFISLQPEFQSRGQNDKL